MLMKLPKLKSFRWRPGPLSPLARLTTALVSICGLLVLLADALLGAFPNHSQMQLQQRSQFAEGVAAQVASLLRDDQQELLRQTMEHLHKRVPAKAVLLRRADGTVLVQSGIPAQPLANMDDDASSLNHVIVPMNAGGRRWGRLEMVYPPDPRPVWLRWLREPLVAMLLTVSLLGSALIGMYLRRALQHLDPRAVIPERVQGAFDVMNEGVVVLDAKGRLLMANQSFRSLHPLAKAMHVGQAMSEQAWLTRGIPDGVPNHPWVRTLKSGAPVSGLAVEIANIQHQGQQLLINTMPIKDGSTKLRGCLVSITDLSALHHANEALQQALSELSESNAQVNEKNEELVRLATRDPLTGCLNRRAFNEAYERLFAVAQRDRSPLSCLVLDIDHFKRVNDTHGHSIGDRVIQETARKLGECARDYDLVCRYGGEEFVLTMPGADAAAARATAERVRQRIEAECGAAVREVRGIRITVSIGVATLGSDVHRPAALIDLADQALYQAKRGGRNRVALAGEALEAAAPTAPAPAPAPAPAAAPAAAPANTAALARTH